MLIFVVGIFIFVIAKAVSTNKKNNASQRRNVNATVVRKRGDTRESDHTSTTYYVTFQVENGDRLELSVPSTEYGMLVEGDSGNLTFQGTRYLSFIRS